MRNPKRIPIILDLLKDNYAEFLKDCGIEEIDIDTLISIYNSKRKEIEEFWLDNPDLRLTQVFVNLGIIPNFPGFWYYKEEVDYVIEKGFCNVEDICFWGVNYTKEMVKLPETDFRLLKNLETDHIRAIIKFYMEQYGSLSRLNQKYLKYFQQRILTESSTETDNLLNNL